MWPKVTVIIVNWNGRKFLDRCLSALLAQTIMPHEIILVDNASSDASVEIARRYPFVRILEQEENLGFARGNNIAVKASADESEWIVLLNPDAFPEPYWLEALLSAARENSGFDVFGSRLVNAADPSVLDGTGDVYHVSGLVWRARREVAQRERDGETFEIFSPCAAAALYRRRIVLDVGGFDEDYFCYVEDVDLGFRLRLVGCRAMYVRDAIVHHVGSATTGGRHSDFSVYHGHRNLVWTFVKDMPDGVFWPLLPLHMAMNLVALAVFTLRGQGRVIWRAKWDAIKGLRRMWRKRRLVQSTRTATAREIWRLINKQIVPAR